VPELLAYHFRARAPPTAATAPRTTPAPTSAFE